MKHKTTDGRPQEVVFSEFENWAVAFGMTRSFDAVRKKLLVCCDEVECVLVPQSKHIHYDDKMSYIIQRTMFPGYFFIATSERHLEGHEIRENVSEIKRILTRSVTDEEGKFRPSVAFLSEAERQHVLDLMNLVRKDGVLDKFRVGDIVTVTRGSFSGLGGAILSINEQTRRAKVDMKMRAKHIPTEVSLYELHNVTMERELAKLEEYEEAERVHR